MEILASKPTETTENTQKMGELSLSAYGKARSTVQDTPLSSEEVKSFNEYFRATMYLCLGMIYLKDNPLLREPLKTEHLKKRLLGHWGSDAGQSFTYIHFNRLIKKYDIDALFISGPGHGAPAVLSNGYLEGTYSEVYPDKGESVDGMRRFFKYVSFPGGIGSHATPETPGSLHEGGELGYSISHAFGTVFDHPDLITLTMVGDGEAETGPLATSWHSNKFLNPITDGAVLPVLHLNGYKINNPTLLSRIDHKEIQALFEGYGWTPYFVEGSDFDSMHQAMAGTLECCVQEIRKYQKQARDSGKAFRPRWPMVILRTPKGWSGPRKINGQFVEGFWRAHQVPITDVASKPESLKLLEEWMRSYEPEKLFDESGKLIPKLRELPPTGNRRMSANPVANGGSLRRKLNLPDFRDYGIKINRNGVETAPSMTIFAQFLNEIVARNMDQFRVMGPDETQSNKLSDIYDSGKKVWLAEHFEEDDDGGNLTLTGGRVMEILSEHTCEGWLEGYVLSGRHGLFNSYEPFIHIVTSMVNQHCKWLEKCLEVEWRVKVASLNILLTSTVWRQDHNGFSHQDPWFLDALVNKSPDVVRIYLPPDANCLLSVMDHTLRSQNYVNVVVADKQEHIQFLSMPDATEHCTKGIGIWQWACNDAGSEPDVVIASCGDALTQEALAGVALLREHLPDLKVRFVNVVDLFKLLAPSEHPHGLSDIEFKALFTDDKPVIFNFHSYPWLIYRLTYQRKGAANLHVHGYREKRNIDTPLELAIRNGTDRFTIAIDAIDAIDCVEGLGNTGAQARETLKNQQIKAKNYAFHEGMDPEDLTGWKWTY